MTIISKDISSKIDPLQAEVLKEIAPIAGALSLPFFVIGAAARDIVFSALFDVPTSRRTLDLDLGIRVEEWDDYAQLTETMVRTGKYARDVRQAQRLRHISGRLIDIVPFGAVENPAGTISWPPDHAFVMRTIGFQEGLVHSLEVRVSHDPDVFVKVCTPAALAVMKLTAWSDGYPLRRKDAVDFLFLMKEYIRAGNEVRLYDSDNDLLAVVDADYELASARLLGRDVHKLCEPATIDLVSRILDEETSDDSTLRLLADMMRGRAYEEQAAQKVFDLLKHFHAGLKEHLPPED